MAPGKKLKNNKEFAKNYEIRIKIVLTQDSKDLHLAALK